MSAVFWTSRTVYFELNPAHQIDAALDVLVDHLWEGWRSRIWRQPGIASVERRLEVSDIPRWIPFWLARRAITKMLGRAGFGGHSYAAVERVALVSWIDERPPSPSNITVSWSYNREDIEDIDDTDICQHCGQRHAGEECPSHWSYGWRPGMD